MRQFCRLLASATAAGLLAGAAPAAAGTSWFIDPERGSDLADGSSPSSAFRHMPGDARATGRAAAVAPGPGDRLLLKGGTRYRGTVMVRVLGTADAPVIIDGSNWGDGPAILDGSDPLPPARPCRSAADCLGAPHWRQLLRVELPDGAGWSNYLLEEDAPLVPARWPDSEGAPRGLGGQIPATEREALDAGLIRISLPREARSGEPVLGLEVMPGAIGYSPPVQLSDAGIRFDRTGWLHWGYAPPPGEVRFALFNLPAAVDRPGTYAVSRREGVAILWPRRPDSRRFSIASGRQGLHVLGGGHVVVRGLRAIGFGGGEARDRNGGKVVVATAPRGPVRVEGLATALLDLHASGTASFLRLAAPDPRLWMSCPGCALARADHAALSLGGRLR